MHEQANDGIWFSIAGGGGGGRGKGVGFFSGCSLELGKGFA